jgi:hypothetical protein
MAIHPVKKIGTPSALTVCNYAVLLANDLHFKGFEEKEMRFLLLLSLLVWGHVWAQDVTVDDFQTVVTTLEEEIQEEPVEKKRVFLQKIKSWIEKTAQNEKAVKRARVLGKVSSIVTTETLRPFIHCRKFQHKVFSPNKHLIAIF